MVHTGIHAIELTLLVLVTLVAALAALAQRLKTPYPIVLVLGGLVLSFVPVIPNVSLKPEFFFLVILPPLIFASALNTSWREFRYNILSIAMLALGLVAFTVAGVSIAAHFLVPGFNWRTGAVLGAVVCTTDVIAVGAIARRVGLPRNLLSIIEGESLVNDASGLLALQFTAVMVTSGDIPSLSHGFWRLVFMIAGGVAAGLVVGKVIYWVERPLRTSALQTLVSVATPYFAYLLGEGIHASGVLATVACGLYIGRRSSESLTSEARLDSRAVWNTIDFALNGFVFVLIGLQLPLVLDGMKPLHWSRMLADAALISAIVIVLRFIWVFPGSWTAISLRRRILKQSIRQTSNRELIVAGWSGMRGVLTLAAALSLPVVRANGSPFPNRPTIIFLAFSVILVGLVGQGLSLPMVIRKLGVCEAGDGGDEERKARKALLSSAANTLERLRLEPGAKGEVAADLLEHYYKQRIEGLEPEHEPEIADRLHLRMQLSGELRQVERAELAKLRAGGEIRDSTLDKLERELDLLDLRWRTG